MPLLFERLPEYPRCSSRRLFCGRTLDCECLLGPIDHPFHVSGASVTIMEQLGHFPMSENPEQLRRYIAPVLGRILKQSTFTKQGEHA
jgi:hypothetical protein